ncbi:MAG: peptide chain release factor N(5)-glutamine methyltransferase [Burkholderiales bacterium]|nr:peptide chain release factor N(5)-glutamine methyltransferase [Burkholderiales bacterium]
MPTIAELLARPVLTALEMRLLLAHALGHPRPAHAHAWLITHDRDPVDTEAFSRFETLLARRRAGEPIAYLIGHREFYGRDFATTPAALIPRPETERLVEEALALLPLERPMRVLDVGTGSGCIAITLALERPLAEVTALDLSEDALALAKRNAQALGAAGVRFVQSDWLAALQPNERFDLIVSNPPYLAVGDPHLLQGDLRFEPWFALTDRADGLSAYRVLSAQAPSRLVPGGVLMVEHGYDQGEAVRSLFAAAGLTQIVTVRDLAGLERVTCGRFFPHNPGP